MKSVWKKNRELEQKVVDLTMELIQLRAEIEGLKNYRRIIIRNEVT